MSDMNAYTRVVNNQRVPSEVEHVVTGERLIRAPVDAKEMIASGHWKWVNYKQEKPSGAPPATTDSSGAPLPLEVVEIPADPASLDSAAEPAKAATEEKGPPVVVNEEPYKPLWVGKKAPK